MTPSIFDDNKPMLFDGSIDKFKNFVKIADDLADEQMSQVRKEFCREVLTQVVPLKFQKSGMFSHILTALWSKNVAKEEWQELDEMFSSLNAADYDKREIHALRAALNVCIVMQMKKGETVPFRTLTISDLLFKIGKNAVESHTIHNRAGLYHLMMDRMSESIGDVVEEKN